jgi:hypothetical protein
MKHIRHFSRQSEAAEIFLRAYLLARGPTPLHQLIPAAAAAKISVDSLDQARKRMGITARPSDAVGWVWSLPDNMEVQHSADSPIIASS